ncbi:MAG TPA: hypothetical protein VNA20_09990 [Frankiaceae bacterium]|nr:hypothetical protein [Frankiaceae bacterium]
MRARVVTMVVTGALLVTAQPADARRTPVPALTGVTTITATTSGYVDVVVPRDARMSPLVEANPDVRFSGSGRFVAVWLTRITEDPNVYDGLWAYRLPSFAGGKTMVYGSTTPGPTCTHLPNEQLPLHTDCTYPKPEALLLHQGRYRLTILTDNAPISVRLSFDGLSGAPTTIRPARRLASSQKALAQRDTVQDRLVTFGDVMRVPARSDVLVIARATWSSQPVLREESVCLRSGQDAAQPFAYAPPCYGGHASTSRWYVNAAGQQRDTWMGYVSSSLGDERTFGVGGSFADSDGVKLVGALAVALQLV